MPTTPSQPAQRQFADAFVTAVTDSFAQAFVDALRHLISENTLSNAYRDVPPTAWFDQRDLDLLKAVALRFIAPYTAVLTHPAAHPTADIARHIAKAVTTGFDRELRQNPTIYILALQAQHELPTLNKHALLIWFPGDDDNDPARVRLTAMVSRQLTQYLER